MSSLKDRMAKGLAITLTDEDEAVAAAMKPSMPTTGPGQTMQITALRKQIEDLKGEVAKRDGANGETEARLKELEEQLASSAIDVEISRLVEVPGRRRYMSPEKKVELRENLRHNKLVHPIVVRRMSDDRLEIVSGHNRVDQYKELDRKKIKAVVEESTDDEAAASAFYANLLQSDLTDFEKYRGFKQMQQRFPSITQAKMAEQSGISEAMISYILAFDGLPSEVIAALEQQPTLIGSMAGKTLAGLAKAGRSAEVIAAVSQLAEGKVDQSQAIKLATAKPAKAALPAETVKIKAGKADYCVMRRASNVVRLQFKSDEEATRVQAALQKVLETESAAFTESHRDS